MRPSPTDAASSEPDCWPHKPCIAVACGTHGDDCKGGEKGVVKIDDGRGADDAAPERSAAARPAATWAAWPAATARAARPAGANFGRLGSTAGGICEGSGDDDGFAGMGDALG